MLAAIGSAIGLGNFWRFPYLSYKYGGAVFFIPYLLCLFLIGIPMMLLELSMGQKFQRGDIGVFRGIHPRLAGIGLASVIAAYCISFYYQVIIAWAVIYFFASFKNPLPWSVSNTRAPLHSYKDCNDLYITEEFFFKDLLRIITPDCEDFNTSDFIAGAENQASEFSW